MDDASDGPALYVATDLEQFEARDPRPYAADLTISGRAYRRLDAHYYAWLRARVAVAKKALDAGRIAAGTFEAIRGAFNAVHAWAVRHLGQAALVAASRTFDARRYEPPRADDNAGVADDTRRRTSAPSSPSGHAFPAEGAWPFTEPVTADAVAQVDAIRDEALALGWTLSALYRNRGSLAFPVGGEYGLVCFVGAGARIAAVTREAIAIDHGRGCVLRFPNPDVEQPWRRAVAGAHA